MIRIALLVRTSSNAREKSSMCTGSTSAPRAEARLKIPTGMTGLYNLRRRHSSNDGLPPVTFEEQVLRKRKATGARYGSEVA
jgi:hypothetical protein